MIVNCILSSTIDTVHVLCTVIVVICTMYMYIHSMTVLVFLSAIQAADANMETHTLARYISESTLQEYSMITIKPSLIAAGSMYLAIRMKKLGTWVCDYIHVHLQCMYRNMGM